MVPLARLVELYETGFTLRQVSDLTGVPRITVHGRLIACGVQMRRRGGGKRELPYDEYLRAAVLYEQFEMSTTEIGDTLGLSPSTVRDRLLRHGVRMRDRSESARIRFARRPMERQ